MFAKMALPRLGGSAQVWTACVLFYQLLLLAAYLYAHALRRLSRVRDQAIVHGLLCGVAALALPLGIRVGWTAPDTAHVLWWLLGVLLLTVGGPFFVLSATSPLLQAWITASRRNVNPYPLYAASNAGSLIALMLYPFVIEPAWGLGLQSAGWTVGYVVFAVLFATCASISRRAVVPAAQLGSGVSISWRRKLRWIGLAFVPSSLMLSVTAYLSESVAPIPLLWTVPLAIYLASFVIVFARTPRIVAWSNRAAPMLIVPVIFVLAVKGQLPIALEIPLHLVLFAAVAIACHGALANDLPEPARLTEFYVYLAVGGLLGGIFNGVIAPLVFPDVFEYPIVLVFAAFALRPPTPVSAFSFKRDLLLPFGFAIVLALGAFIIHARVVDEHLVWMHVLFALAAIGCFSFSGRPVRFAVAVGAVLFVGAFVSPFGATLDVERNFYGVKRVSAIAGSTHLLSHGHTVHGAERFGDAAAERTPLTYYTRSGPLGDIFSALGTSPHAVAVVGLGVGSAACYRRPADTWTLYEIDPGVVAIAQDRRYFRYLADCVPDAKVVVADGRIALAQAPPHGYNLIVMDAYTSDAIPTHLLTREAMQLYRSRLAPGGIIAFHISNRYFDFAPLIAALAQDAGMQSRFRFDNGRGSYEPNFAKIASQWAVVAERAADVRRFTPEAGWKNQAAAARTWTDDYSSIVTLLRHEARTSETAHVPEKFVKPSSSHRTSP